MRLDKFLSHTGFGSRKEVKQLLKKKKVFVNGMIQIKGEYSVDLEKDEITVSGEKVTYRKHVYLMLNKPAGVLSATEDVHQKTVLDLLNQEYAHFDLFPVGRLDKDTEGLLLLTNDGELAHFLLSPKKEVEKTYFAKVEGVMDDNDKKFFATGITLEDGYVCLPAELDLLLTDPVRNLSEVLIRIKEGKFHQVKRMVEACGKEVSYLKRVTMGSLKLDSALPLGAFRPLTEKEIADLINFMPQHLKERR